MEIQRLQSNIKQYDKEYHLKPFHYTKDSSRTNNTQGKKRERDQGAGGGAAADCAEPRLHGYEVESPDEGIMRPYFRSRVR